MLNAYNFFFHHERLRLIEEATRTGRSALTGITKHVADMWKTMDEKDKEPYQALAHEDKIRYQAEVAIWMSANNQRGITIMDEKSSKICKRKREQDMKPVSPKRRQIAIPSSNLSPSQLTTATAMESAPQPSVDFTAKMMSPYQPTRGEMKELADQLGHDGVDAVIRFFLH